MKAKSIQSTTSAGISVELNKSMSDGFKPTLAYVFISLVHDVKEIDKIFSEKGIAIYGASTNGAFIDEDIIEKPISVLLLDIDPQYFRVLKTDYEPSDPRSSGADIATKARGIFNDVSLMIAGSHLATNSEELLRGFQDILGNDARLFGGMAGDDYTFENSHVFTNGFKSYHGLIAIAFDANRMDIKGRALCGWKPVGIERTVTKSIGNRVYEIDGLTALEITKKFSGLSNFTQENEAINLEVAVNFPFQLLKPSGASVLRPGLLINWEDGSFECSGQVPQGSKIRFSLPPDFEIIEEAIEGTKKMKEEEMPEADAVVMYTCAGRLMAFGPLMSQEVEGIKKIWNVPMVGFFSSAELARMKGEDLEMHNFTTCCVALKEIF